MKERHYFKSGCSNIIKVYVFGMYKERRTIWYIIHENWTLFKIWPHLNFRWPFPNISLSKGLTHSKVYIFVIIMTWGVIWHTWKHLWSILKIWPQFDPCATPPEKGVKSPKILSQNYLTFEDFKSTSDSFWPECNIGTSLTTLFNYFHNFQKHLDKYHSVLKIYEWAKPVVLGDHFDIQDSCHSQMALLLLFNLCSPSTKQYNSIYPFTIQLSLPSHSHLPKK